MGYQHPIENGVTLVTRRRTSRMTVSGQHITDYFDFNAYHVPTRIEERYGLDPSVVRVTNRTYEHRIPTNFDTPDSPYVLNLLTSETVTLGGDTIARSWVYDAAGFKTSEMVGGITTTFTPDARGNVATRMTASGHTTSFSYAWGVLKDTVTPEYTITRVINPDSTVQRETQAGRETRYEYDGLGRQTLIDPPGAESVSASTTTVFNEAGRTVVTTLFLDFYDRLVVA
jgi:YD repeat-containing protein